MNQRSSSLTLFPIVCSIALVLGLVTGCSGGDEDASPNRPATLEDLAEQDGRFTQITDPPADGPLIGIEGGEEVRVNDTQTFCDAYWRVSEYRDQILNLLDRNDPDLLATHVEGTGPSAEEAARDLMSAISGGMGLTMVPMSFVVHSREWIYNGLDLETIRERTTMRTEEMAGYDQAYAEIC